MGTGPDSRTEPLCLELHLFNPKMSHLSMAPGPGLLLSVGLSPTDCCLSEPPPVLLLGQAATPPLGRAGWGSQGIKSSYGLVCGGEGPHASASAHPGVWTGLFESEDPAHFPGPPSGPRGQGHAQGPLTASLLRPSAPPGILPRAAGLALGPPLHRGHRRACSRWSL